MTPRATPDPTPSLLEVAERLDTEVRDAVSALDRLVPASEEATHAIVTVDHARIEARALLREASTAIERLGLALYQGRDDFCLCHLGEAVIGEAGEFHGKRCEEVHAALTQEGVQPPSESQR